MDSKLLTGAQVTAVYDRVDWMHRYLVNLHRRMEICNFPSDDPLLIHVVEVLQGVQELNHYLHGLAHGWPNSPTPPPAPAAEKSQPPPNWISSRDADSSSLPRTS